jgi:mono/diheme cytochrome c family protein|tara:strand:- start:1431 stop:1862 length:432 start_codon:yes stop_codon:yes gene_type:complete
MTPLITRHRQLLISLFLLGAIGLCFGCSDGDDTLFATTTPIPEVASNNGTDTEKKPVEINDISNGESQFIGLGCSACHSTGSDNTVGPGLSGIKSKGDDYIRESITNPAAVIVEGFQDLMPKSFADLKKADLDDLVSYLNSLD